MNWSGVNCWVPIRKSDIMQEWFLRTETMILERREEPKPEPSNLNLEIRTGIATDTIPIYFSNWEPEFLHTNF
jgi:hypothetical protein